MSIVEKLANDKALKELFADYLACSLYLEQMKGGLRTASRHVQAALMKRLELVRSKMVKAVKKNHFLRRPPEETVHDAAQYVLQHHPLGQAYFLSRLPLR